MTHREFGCGSKYEEHRNGDTRSKSTKKEEKIQKMSKNSYERKSKSKPSDIKGGATCAGNKGATRLRRSRNQPNGKTP
ncbi:hypothetical protein QLX08_005326 [Tetragonisca angustula]|uniref:Uncharacterized protein n=1 Tax=Tetragonisca angustula TaxID=166442 RepID=A0AAW0ZYZ1_9HYME